jgi:hypothetical protein
VFITVFTESCYRTLSCATAGWFTSSHSVSTTSILILLFHTLKTFLQWFVYIPYFSHACYKLWVTWSSYIIFEVFTAFKSHIAIFRVMMLCSMGDAYHVGIIYRLHLEGRGQDGCSIFLQNIGNPKSYLKTKLHGLSPQANYTDRVTAACRRSDCQLVQIEDATWSAWRIPPAVFSVF